MSSRVLVVIRKEFREYRRNRFILVTMAGLPVVLLLILVAETFALPEGVSAEALRRPVGEALLFLQLIPVMLPTTIAAYAVIGEREQRTLETVLTTPVTERELLAGKARHGVPRPGPGRVCHRGRDPRLAPLIRLPRRAAARRAGLGAGHRLRRPRNFPRR